MPSGGTSARGGRPKGSRNKTTIERMSVSEDAARYFGRDGGVFEGNSLEFLQQVYRHPDIPLSIRIDCAKAASKFENPTLASVEQTVRIGFDPAALSDEDILRLLIEQSTTIPVEVDGMVQDADLIEPPKVRRSRKKPPTKLPPTV